MSKSTMPLHTKGRTDTSLAPRERMMIASTPRLGGTIADEVSHHPKKYLGEDLLVAPYVWWLTLQPDQISIVVRLFFPPVFCSF